MIEAVLQPAPLCAGDIEIIELDQKTFESIQQIAATKHWSIDQVICSLLRMAKNLRK